MLKRNLTEHAAEAFYSDKRLTDLLWQTLQMTSAGFSNDFWESLKSHFYHLLVESIEARYPREHRLTDVRQLMGHMCDGSLFLSPKLPWLDELQERLFHRNGDLLCYREREVKAYVRLAAGIDPTLLAGWHFAQWLDGYPQPEENDLRRVISAQQPFFAPPGNSSLPYADGHVHFGGVTLDSAILEEYLMGDSTLNLAQAKNLWKKEQHELLSSKISQAQKLLIFLLSGQDSTQEYFGSTLNLMEIQHTLPDWKLLAEQKCGSDVASSEWLLREFALAMTNRQTDRWLWLYTYLCQCYRSYETSPEKRIAILCFWQTINLLRRSLIMDGQGLTRFAERYYSAALGRSADYQLNINRLWPNNNDVAEIKSAPLSFSSKFSSAIAIGLSINSKTVVPKPPYIFGEHEITADLNAMNYIRSLERWQFCGHFSRSTPHKQNQRATPNCKELWKNAEKLQRRLQSESGWNSPEFLGGKSNPNFHFEPSHWFRGLDVAGDENALKIEWFSPLIRWLRGGFQTKQINSAASTGFHLSIHAGEDYAHPASGIRHTDETVRFCQMRDGDRLGHALALGIEPAAWAERQGEMILPLDEHLDNLVWLWHYATILSNRLPLAQQVLPLLARRIASFWRESSWWHEPNPMTTQNHEVNSGKFKRPSFSHVTPENLYQAWLLRRNCHFRWKELSDGNMLDSKDMFALPDYDELKDESSVATKLYFARHKWLETGREERLVVVRMGDESEAMAHLGLKRNDSLIYDVETPAELEFMHALQDWLLTDYDQLGLIIETNPTSNMYIARLKSYTEHPIFRWNPPDESILKEGGTANRFGFRRGPIRVLVNTDDPGIMPTTLRTEFLLLREAALELHVGRTTAECWLERLRQYGIEQFHRNHLAVFEPV